MAWKVLEYDSRVETWSVASLLLASIDVIVSFLVLICAVITFFTSTFIRWSGLQIPCSCWAYHEGERLADSKSSSVVDTSSLRNRCSALQSGRPNCECDSCCISSLRAEEKLPVDLSGEDPSVRCTNSWSQEPLMEDSPVTVLKSASLSHFKDSAKDIRDRELMEALQAEREALAALYSELEQERNASATAASEALAMISRLQEEKAAVQMEARQYQRMVVEKEMYDQEAIEVLKEILAKREEEKIVMEEEIQLWMESLMSPRTQERYQGMKVERSTPPLHGASSVNRSLQKSRSIPGRAAKEEQSRYLDRLNRTKSQTLSPIISPEVREISFEESRGTAGDKVTTPRNVAAVQAEASPDSGEVDDSPVELGSSSAVLEPIPFGSAGRPSGTIVVRQEEKPQEPEFMSLKRRWGSRGTSDAIQASLDKVKEDRRIEEKRLSVLEYVWKFEEQLQQQGGRPAVQVARTKSFVDSRSKTQSPVERIPVSRTSGEADLALGIISSEDSLRRRLFVDGDSIEQDLEISSPVPVVHFENPEHYTKYIEDDDGKVSDDGTVRTADECRDDALFVHDVYEVQSAASEAPGMGPKERGKLEMHQPDSDRLGKPDLLVLEDEDTRDEDEEEDQCSSDAMGVLDEVENSETGKQCEDLQGRASYRNLRISSLLRRENSRSIVEEEVEQLTHRLKALEADRYLMKQTIDSLRRENGEMKLLQEIAQQLRELRGMEQKDLTLRNPLPRTISVQVH